MKINQPVLVILTPGFPANEADSTCLTSQQNLIRSINKVHPSLKIIILSFQYPFKSGMYNWHHDTVISFNGQNKGKIGRLLVWRKVWRQLKTISNENNILGLLSFWCGECALVGNYFANRFRLPHYCWILGQDARASNHYVKYTRLHGSQLIASSDFLRDEFYRNHGIQPAHVIPNGIDATAFPDTGATRSIDLLGVGSLIPLKQYAIFIKLVQQLKPQFPKIKAVICGKGPEEKELQTMINSYNLQENILLTGEMPHYETLRLMQQSRILLHPSSYEGFSTVCLEALYAGAKVVSFCRAMNAEIDNWHIVATPKAMQQTMTQLLMRNDSDHLPAIPFSMDATAAAILQLFNQSDPLPAEPVPHKRQRKDDL